MTVDQYLCLARLHRRELDLAFMILQDVTKHILGNSAYVNASKPRRLALLERTIFAISRDVRVTSVGEISKTTAQCPWLRDVTFDPEDEILYLLYAA